MYSLSRVKRGLRHPNLIGRELNRLYYTRGYRRDHNTAGMDIFAADWDNLLILDACSYNLFAVENTIDGRLEKRVSRGASTIEFLRGNFRNRELLDTVYVTSNPQLRWNQEDIQSTLHQQIELWTDDYWDDEQNTVLPETVTEETIAAAEEFPEKRLIAHYMQPHYPFLHPEEVDERFAGVTLDDHFWHNAMQDKIDIDRETAWALYAHNLRQALPAVEELIDALDGKTVVTSDHGNMIGHRSSPIPVREWGHPIGIYTKQLVEVPWLVIDDDRRTVTAESSSAVHEDVEDAAIKERLRNLGYDE